MHGIALSRSKHRICGIGFIREGGIPSDDDVADVLASSRMNPVPQDRRKFR